MEALEYTVTEAGSLPHLITADLDAAIAEARRIFEAAPVNSSFPAIRSFPAGTFKPEMLERPLGANERIMRAEELVR